MMHKQQRKTGGVGVYCRVVDFTARFGRWKSERGFEW